MMVTPEDEWLVAGPQAPSPDPDQRNHRSAATRGAPTSNLAPATKRVKKVCTKSTKAEVACRESPYLAQAKDPSSNIVKRLGAQAVGMGKDRPDYSVASRRS